MKALQLLKTLKDDYIHGELTSDINEAIKEFENYRIKKAMYENILSLINIECKKQALSESSSYELKIFSKTIRDIILNNYVADITYR